jgi:photosystem II stability/assembly factor-like uncharacterized protein
MNPSRTRLALVRRRLFVPRFFYSFFLICGAASLAAQGAWLPTGPDGGDARAFAAVPGQPRHLYMGTTNSWVYESLDGGASWHRLARLDGADNLILDDIVVDAAHPLTVFVAAWRLDRPDGGLWMSPDGGRNWAEIQGMHGQSIRSLAQAPSDPKILFAGTLDGVYRSADSGATWALISPTGSKEIHEVESLAVDPTDAQIVYAGTWHLPWKTTDGGRSWHNIKQGVIDDSDVFSIVIDPAKPSTVYASACSGIYKSLNGGELFKKIQGIPATARRTRVLMQDPAHPEIVYAGTTEGLYKTVDAGKTFKAMTGTEIIVNDIFVDPTDSNHVLLATDRGGVLASQDGGASFASSNQGFSARKVEALLVDAKDPARLLAGVVNDKSFGGAFLSVDGGVRWTQTADGLEGRDVFALAQAADGTVLAGTDRGILILQEGTAEAPGLRWQPRNVIANTHMKPTTQTVRGMKINTEKQVKDAVRELSGRVSALDLDGDAWLASTSYGLLTSKDKGDTWQGGPVLDSTGYLSVAARGQVLVAARSEGLVFSRDVGQTWLPMSVPTALTRIHRIAFSADGTLWLGAREGVYFTRDLGKSWMWVHRLPFGDIDDLVYDSHLGKVLVSSRASDEVYAIDPKTLEWSYHKAGFRISLIRAAGDRLLAASLSDGVVIEAPALPAVPSAVGLSPSAAPNPEKGGEAGVFPAGASTASDAAPKN